MYRLFLPFTSIAADFWRSGVQEKEEITNNHPPVDQRRLSFSLLRVLIDATDTDSTWVHFKRVTQKSLIPRLVGRPHQHREGVVAAIFFYIFCGSKLPTLENSNDELNFLHLLIIRIIIHLLFIQLLFFTLLFYHRDTNNILPLLLCVVFMLGGVRTTTTTHYI